MSEYTKREDAIEALMCYFIPQVYTGEQVDRAKNIAESIINGVPTIEIIHCKDCKHNYNTCFNHGVNEPICDFTDRKLKETDFCSYGERKESGEE